MPAFQNCKAFGLGRSRNVAYPTRIIKEQLQDVALVNLLEAHFGLRPV